MSDTTTDFTRQLIRRRDAKLDRVLEYVDRIERRLDLVDVAR